MWVQLTNMTFRDYLTENAIKPANLSSTFYWTGALGWEPEGLHKRVITVPAYRTTFEGGQGKHQQRLLVRMLLMSYVLEWRMVLCQCPQTQQMFAKSLDS